MKVLTDKQSGTSGNTVSVLTRYGQVHRRRPLSSKKRTNAQVQARTSFGNISARWRLLTDQQRIAWHTYPGKASSRPRLGQSGPLNGFSLFVKINCARAAAGLPLLTLPPKAAKFSLNPVGPLTITNRRGVIDLQLPVPTTPAEHTLVLGSPPCSAGRSFSCRYSILGLLPVPIRRICNITDLYVRKYGVPPVGSRVFIRTRQVINGWEDTPKETNAIVPQA
jgi:hypothetical protein